MDFTFKYLVKLKVKLHYLNIQIMLLKLQSFKWLRGYTSVYEYFTRSDKSDYHKKAARI